MIRSSQRGVLFFTELASNASQLSGILYRQNKVQKSIDVLLPHIDYVDRSNNYQLKDNYYKNLSTSYSKLGDVKLSSLYFEKRLVTKDSIFSKDVDDAINDAQTKYETEKKEAEIERLNLEDQLKGERQLINRGDILMGINEDAGLEIKKPESEGASRIAFKSQSSPKEKSMTSHYTVVNETAGNIIMLGRHNAPQSNSTETGIIMRAGSMFNKGLIQIDSFTTAIDFPVVSGMIQNQTNNPLLGAHLQNDGDISISACREGIIGTFANSKMTNNGSIGGSLFSETLLNVAVGFEFINTGTIDFFPD